MADTNATSTAFDTEDQSLGSVYAKALLGAAGSKAEEVVTEVEVFVSDVFGTLPRLESVLSSPRVPAEAKNAMLDNAFQGKVSVTTLNFLKVVAQHGRMDSLRGIARAARVQLNELQGRVEVLVKTAEPLDDATAASVTTALSSALKKEVVLRTVTDSELIAGIVVQVGDTVYDGSVANQLAQLRRGVVNKTAEQIRESLDRFMVAS
ncbi:MAG TPA: ATP synthase F1 subunit delta [Planctomycetaceae bacterium]|nr:ATP synthase F1 subunit delta [Planctomycetaceae bacterium]